MPSCLPVLAKKAERGCASCLSGQCHLALLSFASTAGAGTRGTNRGCATVFKAPPPLRFPHHTAVTPLSHQHAHSISLMVLPSLCIHSPLLPRQKHTHTHTLTTHHHRELVPTSDMSLPVSTMTVLWSSLDEWRAADAPGSKGRVDVPSPAAALDALFVFALAWGLGASLDTAGRVEFSSFLHKLLVQGVDASAERTDVDLGPGMVIAYPAAPIALLPPEVGAVACGGGCACMAG